MGSICCTFKCNYRLNKCERFCEQQVFTGVTTLVLTNLSKSGQTTSWRKFIQKAYMIYQSIFNLVLHIVGRDHPVWFHDEMSKKKHFSKKLEEFSSFDLQSCDRHTCSSLNIHKNKINCTCNCHAPAMALSSKLLINDFHSSLQNKSPCSIWFGTEHIYWCSPLPPFTLVTMWILLMGKLPILQFFCTD